QREATDALTAALESTNDPILAGQNAAALLTFYEGVPRLMLNGTTYAPHGVRQYLEHDIHNKNTRNRNQRIVKGVGVAAIAMATGGLMGLTAQETIGQVYNHFVGAGVSGLASHDAHGTHTLLTYMTRDTSKAGPGYNPISHEHI